MKTRESPRATQLRRQRAEHVNAASRGAFHAESLEGRILMYQSFVGQGDDEAVWNFPNQTISYSYSNLLNSGMVGVNRNQIIGAVQEAMGIWSAVMPLRFFERVDSGPSPQDYVGSPHGDYDPIGNPYIRWGHHVMDGGGNTLAHADRPGDRGRHGDIHFDRAETWDFDTFLETAAHEFGHATGLDHEVDTDGDGPDVQTPALMNPFDANLYNGAGSAYLFPDDVDGIRSVYGAGLGYVINLAGELHIYGTSGDDHLSVDVSGGNVTASRRLNGTSQTYSFTRPLVSADHVTVRSIHLHGQGGRDFLSVNRSGGLPVWMYGDAGDDYAGVGNAVLDDVVGGVYFFGGEGRDWAYVSDVGNEYPDTFQVSTHTVSRPSYDATEFRFTADASVETIQLRTGTGSNVINVVQSNQGQTVLLGSAGGRDTVNLLYLSSYFGTYSFMGNLDLFEFLNGGVTLNLSSAGHARPITTSLMGGPEGGLATMTFHDANGNGQEALVYARWDSSLKALNYTSGDAADTVVVRTAPVPITVGNGGGADRVEVGGGGIGYGMQNIIAPVTVTQASGSPSDAVHLRLNDTYYPGPRVVRVTSDGDLTFVDGMAPARVSYRRAASVSYELGSGNDSLTFLNISGSEILNSNNGLIYLKDSGGFDAVDLNDAGMGGGYERLYRYTDRGVEFHRRTLRLLPRYLARDVVWGAVTPGGNTVDSVTVVMPTAPSTVGPSVTITGSPRGMAGQTTIIASDQDDWFSVTPRDEQGNSTFHSNIGIGGRGGNDVLYLNAGPGPGVDWTVHNPGDPETASVSGLGTGRLGVYFDIETFQVLGSDADDRLTVDSFRSGHDFSFLGNGGNDRLDVTPVSHDLQSNLVNARSFTFKGGDGADTMSVFNQASAGNWIYTRGGPGLLAQKFAAPAYSWQFTLPGDESVNVYAGAGDDLFRVLAVPAAARDRFDGGGGSNDYVLGAPPGALQGPAPAAAAGLVTGAIRGGINIVGGPARDAITVDNSGYMAGNVVHLADGSLGADAADNLVGPGGSLAFSGAEMLEVDLGVGTDSVTASPLSATAVAINAVGRSNMIVVDLTGVAVPSFTSLGLAVGYYTAQNRQRMDLSGFTAGTRTEVARSGTVSSRHVFYNNSRYDGGDPAPGAADDQAVAPDKQAALPPVDGAGNVAATAASVTSYTSGLNGVMMDVAGLDPLRTGNLGADDFIFRTGTGGDPSGWAVAPRPLSVSVRRGAGDGGSDRVTFVWADGAIANTWLQVTALANLDTGLVSPDVFYFGNLIGEADGARSPTRITATDVFATRGGIGGGRAALDDPRDHNRDGFVNARDVRAVLTNLGRSLTSPSFVAAPLDVTAATSATARRRTRPATRGSAATAVFSESPVQTVGGVGRLLLSESNLPLA